MHRGFEVRRSITFERCQRGIADEIVPEISASKR